MVNMLRCSIILYIILLLSQCLLLLLVESDGLKLLVLANCILTLLLSGVPYLHHRQRELADRDHEASPAKREISWPVFQKIVEDMPIMFDAVDENGVVLFWNRECEKVTGYSSEEIVGNPHALELFYPDRLQRARNLAEFLQFNGSYRDWEVDLLCKDGTTRTISWSNTSREAPIPGWYTWGTGIDITEDRRAEQLLMELASRDELTGLLNRRKIMEILDTEIKRAADNKTALTLCLVDIDHFKKVNDVHGHSAGDTVLRYVADTIRRGIRKADRVGRYGGEEFCILLPHTSISEASLVLERIRQDIAAMTFPLDSSDELSLSISLGQVQYAPAIRSPRQLIDLADTALYRAKRSGRNRLCTAEADLPFSKLQEGADCSLSGV
ncbi:sensor domain-containing diguanylate cyclase [Desulfotalea psychrophila]|uniref:diguanylate cyclase n=1 Tax=Desulfotalea psychrophila (strain LSv54 / DSM 12343) TaxID=177439 RepID=Q6AJN6_DESPS|nr:sensor domain-containing diguanylate cyclase [Desulfotalea psychrophila]CAG37444.1 conserved hypothetical protein [Desulfotalea psychrophila LSv54]